MGDNETQPDPVMPAGKGWSEPELGEPEQMLEAIRCGTVDAFVVHEGTGEQVYVLRSADPLYRLVIEAIGEGALVLDPEGYILDANDVFAGWVGRTRQELLLTPFSAYLAPASRREAEMLLTRQGRTPMEVTVETAAGSGIPAELSILPLADDSARVCVLIRDLTEKKRMQDLLAERAARTEELADQLRRLASELTLAEQRERRRVAVEIHDTLTQQLFACRLKLSNARKLTEASPALQLLQECDAILGSALEYTRTLIADLCPTTLYESGVLAGVTWLAGEMRRYGLNVALDHQGAVQRLSEDREVLIFHTVRELLFNVLKHAHVQEARVHVQFEKDDLTVVVRDRGVGFDPAVGSQVRARLGLGLFSSRERLRSLAGRLDIESAPGRGTCVTVKVPVTPDPAAPTSR